MREILFKAKGQTDEKWHIGFLANMYGGICIIRENEHEWICQSDTICQYTGLTDNNGNKIWENDLLLLEDRIVKIRWWEYSAGFDCVCEKLIEGKSHASFRGIQPQQYKRYEVIGNIFDNLELIGE